MMKVEQNGTVANIQNEFCCIEYDLSSGYFSFKDVTIDKYVLFKAFSGAKLINDGIWYRTCNADTIGFKMEEHIEKTGDEGCSAFFCHNIKGIEYILRFFLPYQKSYILVNASIANKSKRIGLEEIDVLKVGGEEEGTGGFLKISDTPQGCFVYTNTYYKTPSMVRRVKDGFDCRFLDREGDIKYMDRDYNPQWQAKYDGIISDPASKRSFVFGFVTFHRFMGELELKYDSNKNEKAFWEFGLINDCGRFLLEPESSCSSETAYINFYGDVYANQMHYADTLGKFMGAKFLPRPFSGWCSWHHRFFEINEEAILKNAKFAASRQDIFPNSPGGFEYIQIDYGWQKFLGSNEPDLERFPNGMKSVADEIHAIGFKAGIWIAPFWIEEGCGLHKTHPEFLLHDEEGNLVRMDRGLKDNVLYRLDVSNPDAVGYVIEQLGQIINEWGYDMVKMDFLELATITPMDKEKKIMPYNRSLTQYEYFRNACIAIQKFADDLDREVFLSPCGSPFMFLVGIFKSNYVAEDAVVKLSPDSWDEHAGVKSFVRSWATRYYMNNRIWTNNCESIILEEPRPFNEALINATSAALSGGLYFTGDELPALSEERLKIYSKILPLYRETALPLNLFDGENPSVWKLAVKSSGEEWLVIGLINLEEHDMDMVLTAEMLKLPTNKNYLVFDFWEQKLLGSFTESITIEKMQKRSVKLLCIREKKDRPFILSTDIHFTQGAVELEYLYWDEASLRLETRISSYKLGEAKLFIYVPDGFYLIDFRPDRIRADVNGKICIVGMHIVSEEDRTVSLGFIR